ncbi:hypothetical protein GCM10007425_21000 [Lysinibacillus alkalisoli]|uniref:PadR family transcriptional regulator n=1 Tax=Lysinibacillus alkalisoli TaxID=1911548 RepID=A0A917LIB5_9BACI|nr:PadR family transcriptional regulator [Lysinibacillus alkalisoli]GGG26225.1 hypothetical protein GCM10007425_21000 [Lysinibacillus alkalisoli]
MKNYNPTVYALLGILTTNCRNGYDIKQLIDRSLTHFWKISYGQIYPTLKILVQDELAQVETIEQEGKPNKQHYTLTTKGYSILQQWLSQEITQIPTEKNEVLLKLFFGNHQTTAMLTMLTQYQQALQLRLETYQTLKQELSPSVSTTQDAYFWIYTLNYGIKITEAAIEWCQETLQDLGGQLQ